MAKLIYHEAGNQPYSGRVAVAEVVLNRVFSSRFPDNIRDVTYQPHQFSYNSEIAGCPVTEENLGIAQRVIAEAERIFYNPEVLYFRNSEITSGIPTSMQVNWGNIRGTGMWAVTLFTHKIDSLKGVSRATRGRSFLLFQDFILCFVLYFILYKV